MKKLKSILLILFSSSLFFVSIAQPIKIYSNFEGGNILIDSIVQDTVYLRPSLRDTKGEWFYWYFAAKGTKNKTVYFNFTRRKCLSGFGAAISYDQGVTWQWIVKNYSSDYQNRFSYNFRDSNEIRFSVAMPYTKKNFWKFYDSVLSGKKNILRDTFCVTPQKRAVEVFTILPAKTAKYKMFFTARQHSCEMMASYVMEGMIEYFVKESSPFLRDYIEIKFIPFMDIDGVENGDQGKNRIPRDHNRDYSGSSIYCITDRIRSFIPAWASKNLVLAIDMHCPMLTGKNGEQITFYGSQDKTREAEELKLCALLESHQKGDLKFSSTSFYKFGMPNNNGIDLAQGMNLRQFLQTIEGVKIATTLEFPYAAQFKQMITQENARAFGYDLGKAIDLYIQNLETNSN